MKTKILKTATLFATLLSVVGCGKNSSNEIVMWSYSVASSETMVKEYQKVKPDANIRIVPVDGNSYINLLQTSLFVGEDVPDIIWGDYFSRGKLFSLNICEDLSKDPYNFDTSLVSDWVVELCKNEAGELLGVESGPAPTGLLYKRDICKEYLGTDDPTDLSTMFSTWENFTSACETIYENSSHRIVPFASIGDVYCILMGLTNEPYIKDGKCNAETICDKVFPRLEYFVKNGLCGKMDQWTAAYYTSYNNSKYCFNICPSWCMDYNIKQNAPDQAGNLGICMSPGGKMYSLGGTTFSIYNKSAHKSEAWDFIKWALLTEEGQKNTHNATIESGGSGGVGALKTLYNDEMYNQEDEFFGNQKILKFFVDNMDSVNARTLTKYDTTFSDSIGLVLSSMKNGSSAQECKTQVMNEIRLKLPELFN